MPKIKTKRRHPRNKRRQTRKVKPIVNIFTKARFLINKLKNKLKINNKNSIKKYYRGGSFSDTNKVDIKEISDLKNEFINKRNIIQLNLKNTDDKTQKKFMSKINEIIDILNTLESKLKERNDLFKEIIKNRKENKENKEINKLLLKLNNEISHKYINQLLTTLNEKISDLEKIEIPNRNSSRKRTSKSKSTRSLADSFAKASIFR